MKENVGKYIRGLIVATTLFAPLGCIAHAAEGPEPTPQPGYTPEGYTPGDTVEFPLSKGQADWFNQSIKNGTLFDLWTFRTNNLVPGSNCKVDVYWVGDPLMTNPTTPGVSAQGIFKGCSPIR